jgi:hypothetical protein
LQEENIEFLAKVVKSSQKTFSIRSMFRMFLDIHSGIETGSTIETKRRNQIVETMGKKNINQ